MFTNANFQNNHIYAIYGLNKIYERFPLGGLNKIEAQQSLEAEVYEYQLSLIKQLRYAKDKRVDVMIEMAFATNALRGAFCGELAFLTKFEILNQYPNATVEVADISDSNHSLLVIGRDSHTDPDNSASWNEADIIICDPWAKTICTLEKFWDLKYGGKKTDIPHVTIIPSGIYFIYKRVDGMKMDPSAPNNTTFITPDGLFQPNKESTKYIKILDHNDLKDLGLIEIIDAFVEKTPIIVTNQFTEVQLKNLNKKVQEKGGRNIFKFATPKVPVHYLAGEIKILDDFDQNKYATLYEKLVDAFIKEINEYITERKKEQNTLGGFIQDFSRLDAEAKIKAGNKIIEVMLETKKGKPKPIHFDAIDIDSLMDGRLMKCILKYKKLGIKFPEDIESALKAKKEQGMRAETFRKL